VFSTCSPNRPNPIGLHRARILARDGLRIEVDALEAIDGTPVVDVKPAIDPPADGPHAAVLPGHLPAHGPYARVGRASGRAESPSSSGNATIDSRTRWARFVSTCARSVGSSGKHRKWHSGQGGGLA